MSLLTKSPRTEKPGIAEDRDRLAVVHDEREALVDRERPQRHDQERDPQLRDQGTVEEPEEDAEDPVAASASDDAPPASIVRPRIIPAAVAADAVERSMPAEMITNVAPSASTRTTLFDSRCSEVVPGQEDVLGEREVDAHHDQRPEDAGVARRRRAARLAVRTPETATCASLSPRPARGRELGTHSPRKKTRMRSAIPISSGSSDEIRMIAAPVPRAPASGGRSRSWRRRRCRASAPRARARRGRAQRSARGRPSAGCRPRAS